MSTFGYILGVQSALRDMGLLKYASDEEAMEFAGSVDSMMPAEMASPEELMSVGNNITEEDLAGLVKIVNVLLELKAHHDETMGSMPPEMMEQPPMVESAEQAEAAPEPTPEPEAEEPEPKPEPEPDEEEEPKEAGVVGSALKNLATGVRKNPFGSAVKAVNLAGSTSSALGATAAKMPSAVTGL